MSQSGLTLPTRTEAEARAAYAKRRRSYDPECERLARYFIESDPTTRGRFSDDAIAELAQQIQDCVEGWLLIAATDVEVVR